MNILLIDTTKKMYATYVPLALLRLSTRHKGQGDQVELIMAGKRPRRKPDLIYFSFIFLFDYQSDVKWVLAYRKIYPDAKIVVGGVSPSLIRGKFERWFAGKDIKIFEGRDLYLEKLRPDYEITGLDYSYGFTSRGCPNNCAWCVVPVLEGKHHKMDDWKTQISTKYKKFFAFDNNIFACGSEHFENVLKYCHDNGIKIDCNQGMDAEILHRNKKLQDVFLKYPRVWLNIRFAWDSERVSESILFVMDFLRQNKIGAKLKSLYMLYDTDDPPEVVYKRIQIVLHHPAHFEMKMMRFKDLDTGVLLRKWGGIGDLFAHTLSFVATGVISKGKFWNYMLDGDLEDFIFKATWMKEFQKHSLNNDTQNYIKFVESKR